MDEENEEWMKRMENGWGEWGMHEEKGEWMRRREKGEEKGEWMRRSEKIKIVTLLRKLYKLTVV